MARCPSQRTTPARLGSIGEGVDTPLEYNCAMTTGIEICTDCVEDLEHCHGTAIIRDDGSHVCSDDPDCSLAVELHLFWTTDEG